jgi:hypothetical protein
LISDFSGGGGGGGGEEEGKGDGVVVRDSISDS